VCFEGEHKARSRTTKGQYCFYDNLHIIAYLKLVLVLSADNLSADLLQLAPDVDSRLDLLGVLHRRILQEGSVTLPLEVWHNTIDQGQSSSLVEWH
jgi:hypothetical protein